MKKKEFFLYASFGHTPQSPKNDKCNIFKTKKKREAFFISKKKINKILYPTGVIRLWVRTSSNRNVTIYIFQKITAI